MRHDVEAISIAPDSDALQALGKMRRTGSSRLLVAEGDRLVGILSLKDLLSFLHVNIELESPDDNGFQPVSWKHESERRNGVMPDVGGRSHAR
jgi:CBS domain containing-hemolysin-like protein